MYADRFGSQSIEHTVGESGRAVEHGRPGRVAGLVVVRAGVGGDLDGGQGAGSGPVVDDTDISLMGLLVTE